MLTNAKCAQQHQLNVKIRRIKIRIIEGLIVTGSFLHLLNRNIYKKKKKKQNI